jgi:DhnA family fructose-bisphosphate aldolase class Ia
MAYARGDLLNEFDYKNVAHVARIAAELGADIVKCNYTGTIEGFQLVVQACPVPILIAGGPLIENVADLFRMVSNALTAGAAGISIGRNVFEYEYPDLMIRQLYKIVHEKQDPAEANDELEEMKYRVLAPKRVVTLK